MTTGEPPFVVYATPSGIECTINEFINGHGMSQMRYRSQGETHAQDVLTPISLNIERICALDPSTPEQNLQAANSLGDLPGRIVHTSLKDMAASWMTPAA